MEARTCRASLPSDVSGIGTSVEHFGNGITKSLCDGCILHTVVGLIKYISIASMCLNFPILPSMDSHILIISPINVSCEGILL